MLWLDLPLVATAGFFFAISWLYGWGLLHFFRHNFRWSLAATVGIASVVSCTGIFVWQVRGLGVDTLQPVWDLAIVFLAALPGMIWTDLVMADDRERGKRQLARLEKQVREQDEMIAAVERIIAKHEAKAQQRIDELVRIFEMREKAREYINSFKVNNG
jgi:hypothetical protein